MNWARSRADLFEAVFPRSLYIAVRPRPIDVHVGRRLRARRLEMELSQPALAQMAQLNEAVLQSYEQGQLRVSPDDMLTLSEILRVRISYFFEDIRA